MIRYSHIKSLLKKKLFWNLLNGKKYFIQNYDNRYNTVIIGVHTEYSEDSWGFAVKEQSWGRGVSVDRKLVREDFKGREILAKPT